MLALPSCFLGIVVYGGGSPDMTRGTGLVAQASRVAHKDSDGLKICGV